MEREKCCSTKKKKVPVGVKRKADPKPCPSKVEPKTDSKNNKEAILQIQNVLMLHAWRCQKEKNKELNEQVKTLKLHGNNMEIQIYALHQLLDAEKGRVTALYDEVHRLINSVEQYKIEKAILQKDKQDLSLNIEELKNNYTKLENSWRNQKNELMAAKCEAENWEKQLMKEREKLSKIRNDKKALSEDMNDGCTTVDAKTNPRIKNAALRNLKKPLGRSKEEHNIEKIDFNKKK